MDVRVCVSMHVLVHVCGFTKLLNGVTTRAEAFSFLTPHPTPFPTVLADQRRTDWYQKFLKTFFICEIH